jgi:hypothetical protein
VELKTDANNISISNAVEYVKVCRKFLPIDQHAYNRALRLKRGVVGNLRRAIEILTGTGAAKDDFAWDLYHLHYRAEVEWHDRLFTLNVGDVDFRFIDHRLYLLGDCKPVHSSHRCLWEAVCNLPTFRSVAEIGCGAGYHLASLKRILGNAVAFSSYDLSATQLALFKEYYPAVFGSTRTGLLDISERPIGVADRPDVVFEFTVIMHIKRPSAYEAALRNFLGSANRFAVILDNYEAHDYFTDLTRMAEETHSKLYYFDSGACIAIVVSLDGTPLDRPYQPLAEGKALQKYA